MSNRLVADYQPGMTRPAARAPQIRRSTRTMDRQNDRRPARDLKPGEYYLFGASVPEWSVRDLDIDAITRPLGLTGPWQILGIDNAPAESKAKQLDKIKTQEDLDVLQAFTIELQPSMTVLHILRAASLVHIDRNGEGMKARSTNIYFETLTLEPGHVARLTMGS